MHLFGLHVLDAGMIALYVLVILWLGKRAGKDTHDTKDFFIAGRKLGKVYQFFLNFGNATNADQAVAVSREIYRQGIGGMWIQYLVLFITPFYWFTTLLFRRSRFITTGDFFTARFQSPFLGGAFAVFTIVMAFIGGGVSYMVAGKTMAALTPKPLEACTPEERRSVELFRNYKVLREKPEDTLTAKERARLAELRERDKRKELRAFVSWTDEKVFYVAFALLTAAYTVLGGFRAAAVTDAVQGVLIVFFSLVLIPVGLLKVGGFAGLHASVPDYMFALFGSASTSEYAWYTILAMILANLVSIVAVGSMMATAGSARDETTARVGMISGMFFKRFIMLFWALAGLLAIALYRFDLHDPDLIWGYMTRDLLFPGAVGLMLSGILAANMSSLDATSVTNAALFIRNLYQPLFPGRSERHYIDVSRAVIVVILLGGVVTAVAVDNLLDLFKYFISVPAVFGAAVWLGFTWRRLTRWAVILQVVICFTLYAVIPNLFQGMESINRNPDFLLETRPRTVTIVTGALEEDVAMGRADKVGQRMEKPHTLDPVGVFFDRVVRDDPADPASPRRGMGRFHAELWLLSLAGMDLAGCTKAQLVALRFLFDALFPFALLFLFSLFTRPAPKEAMDRFYARIHTPVQPTPEADEEAVARTAARPEEMEARKLFPGSQWEIAKPGKGDLLGFGGCWLVVGIILFLLWFLAGYGAP